MKTKKWRFSWVPVIFLGLSPVSLKAQLSANPTQLSATPAGANGASPSAPQNFQAVSQTGLLPLFAVDMSFDPSWVDSTDVPTKSANYSHSGVNDPFQQAWEALKPGGFNAIRFDVNLQDPQAAVRLANLCIWAKANNVLLIPVLKSSGTGTKAPTAIGDAAGSLLSGVVTRLHSADAQQFAAYTQISYYQIESAMNHRGLYPNVSPETAQQTLLAASDALRKAEAQALQGTSVQPTPILVSASFDYELIRQGAIAGVPLDPGAERNARASMKQYLAPFASAPNIDAINVEWFPRSISSGDVDRFAPMLRELQSTLQDKQLTLTTGFSSAFNPVDQQAQFFTLTFSNLSDFRTSNGANSRFLGVVFRKAFKGPAADSKPPNGISDTSSWNWNQKAQQLFAMWSQGAKSDDLTWWLTKVHDNMGMVALSPNGAGGMSVTPLPAEQAFQQIASTVAQVSQNVTPPPPVPGASSLVASTGAAANAQSGMPSGLPGSPTGAQASMPTDPTVAAGTGLPPGYTTGAQMSAVGSGSTYQQMLFTILQQFSTVMASNLAAKFTTPSGPRAQGQFDGTSTTLNPQNFANGATQQQPGVAGNYSGTAPAVSQPGSSVSTGSNSSTNPVYIGPQDITVDSASVIAGQPVHVTAQLHNSSTNQDLSGLTALLSDPSATTSNPVTQGGINIPRSGASAAQLTWTPGPTDAGQHQMMLQVLDGSGAQLTTAPVPVITVTGGSATAGASASSTNPSGSQASTSSAGQSSAQSSAASPQIAYIGQTNSALTNDPTQPQSLSVQVANPSNVPTQPAQVQLFVDGTASQTQPIGALLPKQTQSAVFSGVAPQGKHTIKVVVTSANGGTASATKTVTTTAPAGASASAPPSSIAVRASLPKAFSAGTSNQSASSNSVNTGSSSVNSTTQGTRAQSSPGPPQAQVRSLPGASATPTPSNQGATAKTRSAFTASSSAAGAGTTASTAVPTSPTPVPVAAPSGTAGNRSPATTQPPPGLTSPVATKGYVDLSVSVSDIQCKPVPPRRGQSATFTALIRNLGTQGVQGASVVFQLFADGKQAAASRPLLFRIPGRGTFVANWTTTIPTHQRLQLAVSVTANGDVNVANNRASVIVQASR